MIPELRVRQDAEHVAQLAASLAHSLNNLLQVVNGNLEILELRIEDPNLRGNVDNALTAARQLTELARELHADSMDAPRRSGDGDGR